MTLDAPEEVKAELLDVLLESDDLETRVGPAENPKSVKKIKQSLQM